MKIIIFGNICSGKSYLSDKIRREIPNLEYLAVDDFRRNIGDGSMEKEIAAKQSFLNSIKANKLQLIEATGLGDTGESIAKISKSINELKFIIILKTPLAICLERLNTRVWDVPYPAPPTQAFVLATTTDKLINAKAIQTLWQDVTNYSIMELESISEKKIKEIIQIIKSKL